MRHRKKNIKLNRDADHRKALMRNLATSIIIYEKIKTTKSKAKAVQPIIDKIINIAKKDDLQHSIRQLNNLVFDKNASKKAIEDLKSRYHDRNCGYTRITPIGVRSGDNAPLVQIELV